MVIGRRLLHPADVARYRDGNKTDRADAKALLEASRNHALEARAALADEAVPDFLKQALFELIAEIRSLEEKADGPRTSLTSLLHTMPGAKRLMTVPGVGVLTATAMVACVGDIHRFRSGRHFASWLGLTPREHSSGASRRLGSITRKGNSYLRTLLIHGARSALRAGEVTDHPDDLRAWAKEVSIRHCHNACPAIAKRSAGSPDQ